MARNFLFACLLLFTFGCAGFAQGFRVTGRVNPAEDQTPGTPVPGIPGTPRAARGNLALLRGETERGTSVNRQAFIAGDNEFEFADVAPGFYRVDVVSALPLSVDVTVRDRDVEVQVGRPWFRVSGAVTVEGGGPVPRFELDFVKAPAGDGGRSERYFVVQGGSRFTVDMPGGLYRVSANGLPFGFDLKSVGQAFEVSDAAPAEIELVVGVSGAPWVKISGKVEGAGSGDVKKVSLAGPAVASAIVAVVSPDGAFEFPKVPQGVYEARVFPSPADFARSLTVGAGGQTDFRIAMPSARGTAGEFVRVEPGVFMMGCPAGEQCNNLGNTPAHQVSITRSFDMGKYEVTQAQWEAAMGANPSTVKGPARPVENVEWEEVQEFIAMLNALGDGYRYRLPTEAEWEYAARAGSSGPDPGPDEDFGWFNTNAGGETHPVGEKKPNAWGLHDMRGNVMEWVKDWFEDASVATGPQSDPTGPRTGKQHVLRGGQFAFNPQASRTTSRAGTRAAGQVFTGFRLLRERVQEMR